MCADEKLAESSRYACKNRYVMIGRGNCIQVDGGEHGDLAFVLAGPWKQIAEKNKQWVWGY